MTDRTLTKHKRTDAERLAWIEERAVRGGIAFHDGTKVVGTADIARGFGIWPNRGRSLRDAIDQAMEEKHDF